MSIIRFQLHDDADASRTRHVVHTFFYRFCGAARPSVMICFFYGTNAVVMASMCATGCAIIAFVDATGYGINLQNNMRLPNGTKK